MPQSRSPGAGRCPGRSGGSAEGKGQLRLSLVPGCAFSAAVGQEHSCESPLGQFRAGSSCQSGQVEVSGAHEPFQYQAQVAQSDLDSSCVPPSRSPGADRCPGRSGGSAEDKGASQDRSRSQVHTSRCSIRLRLPSQVWIPVACHSPGAQMQVGAQAGQVAVLSARGCRCLLCQGALSLLHAVRSTGARARSVNSMQEVLASQVRLRSQVHTGHSSIRLRLPCQVWTQVACRSPGPQLHVGAQAGQVAVQKGNGSCSIQVHQVACVAKPWFTT